jgi:integrase
MYPTRLPLSEKAIIALRLAPRGQHVIRDTELPGFFLVIGKRRKTFMAQGDLRANGRRKSVRIKIGEVGQIKTREARAKAKEILGSIGKGVDPRPTAESFGEARESGTKLVNTTGPTLRAAWSRYRDSHLQRKGRSDGTVENYRDHVERLMVDWLDQPLSMLGNDPSLVASRHERITAENGAYIANGCMRSLRAIYNHARKTARSLPAENPVIAIDWNAEKRRNTALGLGDLLPWVEELRALENPIRREFHLFLLLSGSRPDALKRARIEHVNLRTRILHLPNPKGGEEKAFDIPLSRALVRGLVRVIRLGRVLYPTHARKWLFPAESEGGHLAEHKEGRTTLSKWGNDLRQTYRTVAQATGIADLDIHLLMNHSVPGVNAGYITRSKLLSDHLRQQQGMISRKMVEAFRGRSIEGKKQVAVWPLVPARTVLADVLRGLDVAADVHAEKRQSVTRAARITKRTSQQQISANDGSGGALRQSETVI